MLAASQIIPALKSQTMTRIKHLKHFLNGIEGDSCCLEEKEITCMHIKTGHRSTTQILRKFKPFPINIRALSKYSVISG